MVKINSYAKVNLFLLVKKKNKKTGLHKIDSVVKLVRDLYDEIEINKSKTVGDKIRYFNSYGQIMKINDCIIERTLNILRHMGIIDEYFDIVVYKNIPLMSGLGGGSSNAAAIMNYIFSIKDIKIDKFILKIANIIGSDVPFFLMKYDLAYVSSYGQKVIKYTLPFEIDVQITSFPIAVKTSDVFNKFDTLERREKVRLKDQLKALDNGKFNLLKNDLQNACFLLVPDLLKKYNYLNETSMENKYKLTGSGTTLFKIIY